MIPLSPDERRIITKIRELAAAYAQRHEERIFGFDGVRAKILASVADRLERGEHR